MVSGVAELKDSDKLLFPSSAAYVADQSSSGSLIKGPSEDVWLQVYSMESAKAGTV